MSAVRHPPPLVASPIAVLATNDKTGEKREKPSAKTTREAEEAGGSVATLIRRLKAISTTSAAVVEEESGKESGKREREEGRGCSHTAPLRDSYSCSKAPVAPLKHPHNPPLHCTPPLSLLPPPSFINHVNLRHSLPRYHLRRVPLRLCRSHHRWLPSCAYPLVFEQRRSTDRSTFWIGEMGSEGGTMSAVGWVEGLAEGSGRATEHSTTNPG
jgi:hypothetical protein